MTITRGSFLYFPSVMIHLSSVPRAAPKHHGWKVSGFCAVEESFIISTQQKASVSARARVHSTREEEPEERGAVMTPIPGRRPLSTAQEKPPQIISSELIRLKGSCIISGGKMEIPLSVVGLFFSNHFYGLSFIYSVKCPSSLFRCCRQIYFEIEAREAIFRFLVSREFPH